jgi:hypothetical protein
MYQTKGGHEMTVGAWRRFSALDRAFRDQKAASKNLYQAHIRDLGHKRSIGYIGPTRVWNLGDFLKSAFTSVTLGLIRPLP